MAQHTEAVVVFRRIAALEVLIGHMGGPFWTHRDEHAWSFPKGLPEPGDTDAFSTARREFAEELGFDAPAGDYVDLGEVQQAGGKTVRAWAVEADPDLQDFVPGHFAMPWPPRSGRMQSFPELDKVAWVGAVQARTLLVKAQSAFLDRLEELLQD